ncbi:MAG: 2-hydroxyacid dehydrogenase [Flavobacteriales bacterium]|jgi:D-3-phosphoglycerate dehydrogenase|uniref:2-hydroxyacid dehydrogenase n=1 Tax=Blattabacterium sp. (Mastotermes darwiniensis) TaxID=39768 RepID=UPI000231DE46|nr:2-hydroxyacid dehydrogenase [Blattabacterium sp. (Mastotermes darwiniensis)]AER40634.1 phosphoglycerate dehydrogenase [Blattabacterium sp. (Mastotermes darwiniensis) str. MADAR]MDR1804725.1 2-hydroxyacid dehydrogenase [Flavobacteriales bacterium]
MKILILDKNHPFIIYKLRKEGFICDENYHDSIEYIIKIISLYDGIILRNRFKIDKEFIEKAENLKFIARVGSGIENIDKDYALKRRITLISTPEENKDSVAEHTIAMLLSMMNHIIRSDQEIRKGKWNRESNRGIEIMGKTVGIIGYGNTGKALAKKLSGFESTILCYDILPNIGDIYAKQVDIKTIFMRSDIISLHVPYTKKTKGMVNEKFIKKFHKPFYFINTSRGECVLTNHLIKALKDGKIYGACLDVLEYETLSFEHFFHKKKISKNFFDLIHSNKILLTPHIAGYTKESKYKMAKKIVKKIISFKFNKT